jgi:aryl-alcohol dehydrogenase-like predicted oxidoreductase
MTCLLKLKDQGKIRAVGICNPTLEELQEYLSQGPIVSDQFRYSMLYRDPEQDILPLCAEKNVATLTYMSLEQGLLTGKIGMDRQFRDTEFRSNEFWNPWFILENRQKVLDLLTGWKDLTDRHQCTLAQLVLAWTLAQPGITHALAGARNEAQVRDNARAAELTLTDKDLQRMRSDLEALGEPKTTA